MVDGLMEHLLVGMWSVGWWSVVGGWWVGGGAVDGSVVVLIASAESWSARGASHQPAFMGSCLAFSHTCLPCLPSGRISPTCVLFPLMIGLMRNDGSVDGRGGYGWWLVAGGRWVDRALVGGYVVGGRWSVVGGGWSHASERPQVFCVSITKTYAYSFS